MNPSDIVKMCRGSAFHLNKYTVDIGFKSLWRGLAMYTDVDNQHLYTDQSSSLFFGKAVPAFQRDANHWDTDQQVAFIENLMKGVRTSIKFFELQGGGVAQIVDGLQRLTAIAAFLDGGIKAFGLYIDQYGDKVFHVLRFLNIEIYTFTCWYDVGRFYIDINEHITHSPEDIQKCKDWFRLEKGIAL